MNNQMEWQSRRRLTFTSIFIIDGKLKISPVTESTLIDDFPLQFEDRDTGAIKSDP
jgi:hypothetical protein